MADPASITISVLALAVSTVTAWLTLFRRGSVKMTQPTVIFFGPDTPRARDDNPLPKVFLRTLLFSTTRQNFNIWVYGDEKLVRGSGLFVGETGVAANHHFLTPRDGSGFCFTEGRYRLEVFAHLLGDTEEIRLFSPLSAACREASLLPRSRGLP